MQPYPAHLVQRLRLKDGTWVTIRPIRPEDAVIEQEFVRRLSDESRYNRFMDTVRELSPQMLSHFTQVDYDRHMALIVVTGQDEAGIQIAVARYIADDDRQRCEFAIVVADDWQQKGLGALLMQALIAAARSAGMRVLYGDVLASNHKMLRLMGKMGFSVKFNDQDARMMRAEISL
jgi:acetyltransferase